MIDHISSALGASIRIVCKTLGVPRSSYYHAGEPTATEREDRGLGDLIEQVFEEHLRRYGHRRIHRELRRREVVCGQRRIRRLMRERRR